MNYCRDCKHFEPSIYRSQQICHRPNSTYDLVNGNSGACWHERRKPSAYDQVDVCGPEGKYFEPKEEKPSLWRRIIGV